MKQWLERADQRANSTAHAFGNLLVESAGGAFPQLDALFLAGAGNVA